MDREAIESDADAIGELQLLLSEVRTALSLMRTGIAILALPLSVFSVLVATSRYYDALKVLGFLLPLATLCAVLMLFGVYLVLHSWRPSTETDVGPGFAPPTDRLRHHPAIARAPTAATP